MEPFDPQQPRGASYPAVYFIRNDLSREKIDLFEDLRELQYNTWGYPQDFVDSLKKEVEERIAEITDILRKIETGVYVAPEDDV